MENKFHVQVRELKIYSTILAVQAMSEDKIISIHPSTLSMVPKVHELGRFMQSLNCFRKYENIYKLVFQPVEKALLIRIKFAGAKKGKFLN